VTHVGTIEPLSRPARIRTQVIGRLNLGLYTEFTRFGLRRDLDQPFEKPSAKIPISVRPLQESDLAALFSSDGADLKERLDIAHRLAFVARGARGGFVAIDSRNHAPCYVQWLFGTRDSGFIRALGGFPPLEAGEALVENAYTPPNYRGLGIMPAAMALIAEHARDLGARSVLTFVDHDNIASLKGCQRAGFRPDLLHYRRRYAFGVVTRDWFEKLAPDDPRRGAKF